MTHTDSVEAGWREKVRDWWYSVQDLLAEKDVCLHERKRVELEAIIKELEATNQQQVEEAVRKRNAVVKEYKDEGVMFVLKVEDGKTYEASMPIPKWAEVGKITMRTPNHQG